MDCNCNGNASAEKGVSTGNGRALKQGFRRFWPDQYAFPPGAPWLAAAVTRPEAFDLVQRFSGKFPGLETGDFASYAALVSSLLYSDAQEYAAERRKKKKKNPPPKLPDPPSEPECYTSSTQCSDGRVIAQTCCPVEESLGGVYLCTPDCPSEVAVMESDTDRF